MANCSPDVVWSVVKDTSAHLLKRKASRKSGMGKAGAQLTLEPNNLTGINSFKYSGLANAKTADVTPVEGGVVLTTKTKNAKRAGKVRRQRFRHTASQRPHRAAQQQLRVRLGWAAGPRRGTRFAAGPRLFFFWPLLACTRAQEPDNACARGRTHATLAAHARPLL